MLSYVYVKNLNGKTYVYKTPLTGTRSQNSANTTGKV